MCANFTNFEIATMALFLIGGESDLKDIEDVAMKANEIAPGRFAWRKYPEQIDASRVSSALFDARKDKNGKYVLGSGQKGWMLTEAGLHFVQGHIAQLQEVDLKRKAQTPKERQWERNERARMVTNEVYPKFTKNKNDNISIGEVESFFRLDDYVLGQARERKLIRVLNVFGDDQELGAVVRELAAKLREKTS